MSHSDFEPHGTRPRHAEPPPVVKHLALGFALVFGLFAWLLPGAAMTHAMVTDLRRHHRFDAESVVAHGTIANIRCPPQSDPADHPASPNDWQHPWHAGDILAIRFRDERLVARRFTTTERPPGRERPRLGAPVDVRYLPTQPDWVVFAGSHRAVSAWDLIPLAFPLLWFLGPFGLLALERLLTPRPPRS